MAGTPSGTRLVRQNLRVNRSTHRLMRDADTQFRSRQASFQTLTRSSMRSLAHLLVVIAAAAVRVASDQQVLQHYAAPGLGPTDRAFNKINSTGNLMFWSVSSLLQQRPNTRYINGMVTFQ